ncbi:MAG: hypothetical protein Q9208_005159 [Pyrenodesmia sp. 3 TL-2023]
MPASEIDEKDKEQRQWDADELTGIDLSKHEAGAAAYLGYRDKRPFRQWQCTHAFLDLWLRWSDVNVVTKAFRVKALFEVLNSARQTGELEKLFGGTLSDLAARYPVRQDRRVRHLAGIVYQLVHTPFEFNERYQHVVEKLPVFEVKQLPKITEAPAPPAWGPFATESWGESYNRAVNALRTFTNTFNNRWDERQGKAGDAGLKSEPIAEKNIPTFMRDLRPDDADNGSMFRGVKEPVQPLDPKSFWLSWADPGPVLDELEDKFGTISPILQLSPDPRVICGEEWKDQIRRLYGFDRLQRNFTSISCRYTSPGPPDEGEVSNSLDLLHGNWIDGQETFRNLPEDSPGMIRFKTRQTSENELCLEWDRPPTALRSYVKLSQDGNLERTMFPLEQHEPIETPSTALDNDTHGSSPGSPHDTGILYTEQSETSEETLKPISATSRTSEKTPKLVNATPKAKQLTKSGRSQTQRRAEHTKNSESIRLKLDQPQTD